MAAIAPYPTTWGAVQCRLVLAQCHLLLDDTTAARSSLSEAQPLLTQLPPEDLVSEALAVLACHRYEEVPAPDSDAKR